MSPRQHLRDFSTTRELAVSLMPCTETGPSSSTCIAEPEVLDEVAVGAAGDEERANGGRLSAGPTLETANDADVEEARNQAQSDAVGGDGR